MSRKGKRGKHKKKVSRPGVAQLAAPDETSTIQALLELTDTVRKSDERHAAAIALLREQLELYHREVQALQEKNQPLKVAKTPEASAEAAQPGDAPPSEDESTRVPSTGIASATDESGTEEALEEALFSKAASPDKLDAQPKESSDQHLFQETMQARDEALSSWQAIKGPNVAVADERNQLAQHCADTSVDLEQRLEQAKDCMEEAEEDLARKDSSINVQATKQEAQSARVRWWMENPAFAQEKHNGPRLRQCGFLTTDVWPALLKFLPVADVVNMQTRAVSSFFSSSKVWLDHLIELMDIDSLPHYTSDSKHPGVQWCRHFRAKTASDFERVTRLEQQAEAEGFGGYRYFFYGLPLWHERHPQIVLQFVQKLTELHIYSSIPGRCDILASLNFQLITYGGRALKLPIATGLLKLLLEIDLEKDAYKRTMGRLEHCESSFQHLSSDVVLELLEKAFKWEDRDFYQKAFIILARMANALLTEDSEANLAERLISTTVFSKFAGKGYGETAKRKLILLLTQRKRNDLPVELFGND